MVHDSRQIAKETCRFGFGTPFGHTWSEQPLSSSFVGAMRNICKSLVLFFFLVTSANAVLIFGTANSVTPVVNASGALQGVSWTATTTSSSPFLGINIGSGVWNLSTPLDPGPDELILGAGDVNAGDSQTFTFSQPISDIFFYVENFDSSSAANVTTDGALSIIDATSDISFSSTSISSGFLSTTNSSFDGVGDVILKLTGPTSFIQFDYTGGEQANAVFYGFAVDTLTTVPEPSGFLCLLMCAAGLAYVRRNRVSATGIVA